MIKIFVTDTEFAKIKIERQKKRNERRARLHYIKLLRIAADYSYWLHRKSRGSSFSTFTDEFGYNGKDAVRNYELVLRILEFTIE